MFWSVYSNIKYVLNCLLNPTGCLPPTESGNGQKVWAGTQWDEGNVLWNNVLISCVVTSPLYCLFSWCVL